MRVRYSFSSRRTGRIDNTNKHRIPYPEIAKKVINESDIIAQVLDARFIEETIDYRIENDFKDKKAIYIANKSDLNQHEKAKDRRGIIFVSCIERKGIKKLRDRIKIEAKRFGKEQVNVGVVGYPNTGKSSIINVLVGKRVAKTAPKSGTTRGIQKIKLSNGIMIFDTPGVIPETEKIRGDRYSLSKLAVINVKNYDKVSDPEFVIAQIMKGNPGLLEKFYGVEAKGDAEVFLENLGRKRNMLIKGGEINIDRTARSVLRDWQEGKIRVKK